MDIILTILLVIILGLVIFLVWYIPTGLAKLHVYEDEIEAAFRRDCKPFKPNQLWLVKLMMFLFWPKIDWLGEVRHYKNGKPQPLVSTERVVLPGCFIPGCSLCNRDGHNTFNRYFGS